MALCHQLAGFRFPWDITRSLELALLKTFCLPSISGLLQRTGEFEQRPRKRYDDTGLMVAELLRCGPDSERGRAVIARMNRIHGAYAIGGRDYLYVLSTFVCEPIRWLARYGWRALNPQEEQAIFHFWRLVGERMGIPAIPQTLAELVAFNQAYEAGAFASAASNRRVADATLAMLLSDWPAPLRPLLRRVLTSLLSGPEAACLGWPQPPSALQRSVLLALRCRSRLAGVWQRLRPPIDSRFYSQRPTPSYGANFQLEQLGPPAMLPRLNRARWSGQQRRIGLTGGIASGKSRAGGWLEQQAGLPLLDADLYARQALAPGSAAAAAVLERYGQGLLSSAPGAAGIDRAALGRIVFHDIDERRWLEQLIHPLVRQRFDAELARLRQAPLLVLMIPLLFETGLEELCSEVWLVDCEPEQQLARLMARDGCSEADAKARIQAQWPIERKRPLADLLIDNRSDLQTLESQLRQALTIRGISGHRAQ